MDQTNENLVPVCTTEDEVQEALIVGALQDAGIHFVVRGFHDEAFDGLFESSTGHSRISVLEDDVAKAEQVLADIPNPKNEE